jgi:sortase A
MRNKVATLLFIVGIILLLFPIISRIITKSIQSKVVYEYEERITSIDSEKLSDNRNTINNYNDNLANNNPIVTINQEIDSLNYSSEFDFFDKEEAVGSISIPKIDIMLPLFDSLDNNNLERGVVHLKDTSYPNGQKGTHSVIVGHSGITMSNIFDNLDKLEIGDYFSINYLGIHTNYQVIAIKTVLPDDTENLKIEEDKCLVTLVTCTPKGINSHRLLVTGEKIENENTDEIIENIENEKVDYKFIEILTISSLAVIVLIVLFISNKK